MRENQSTFALENVSFSPNVLHLFVVSRMPKRIQKVAPHVPSLFTAPIPIIAITMLERDLVFLGLLFIAAVLIWASAAANQRNRTVSWSGTSGNADVKVRQYL